MKVERMIEELKKYNPEAEVKLHHREGNNALFVLGYVSDENIVVIEDKSDSDLGSELHTRFTDASEQQLDELDFFMDLLETGFTLEDIKLNLPDRYEYAKKFMEDHALI